MTSKKGGASGEILEWPPTDTDAQYEAMFQTIGISTGIVSEKVHDVLQMNAGRTIAMDENKGGQG